MRLRRTVWLEACLNIHFSLFPVILISDTFEMQPFSNIYVAAAILTNTIASLVAPVGSLHSIGPGSCQLRCHTLRRRAVASK